MSDRPINLLQPGPDPTPPSRRGRMILVVAIVLVASLGIGLKTISESTHSIGPNRGIFSRVRAILTGESFSGLRGEADGRINILLLGMGGEGHDGPYLTDTMILASIAPESRRVGLLTIPRDLVANIPGYGYRKINNANAFGQAVGGESNALELARETVSKTFDLPIHYVVRLDFSGFDELIDAVGGVTVRVEREFTDAQYPLEDGSGKTTTIHFDSGSQHMDGETSLQFVRSRHGTNGEGSDFARSRRQEKVLLGLRDKVLSGGTLISPQHIASIYSSLRRNVATDLSVGEMVRLVGIARDIGSYTVMTKVLEEGPGAPLASRITEDGAFVLEPRGFDYGILHDIATNILIPVESKPNRPRVEVQNGTLIAGAAAVIGDRLKDQGFEIVRVRNAAKRDVAKTAIYDLTTGKRADELARLKVLLSAPASSPSDDKPPDVDFVVIIGSDQKLYQ